MSYHHQVFIKQWLQRTAQHMHCHAMNHNHFSIPDHGFDIAVILGFGYQRRYLTLLFLIALIPVLYPLPVALTRVSPKLVLVTQVYQLPPAMTQVSALTIYSKLLLRLSGQVSALMMMAPPRPCAHCSCHRVALMVGSLRQGWDSRCCLTIGMAISTVL